MTADEVMQKQRKIQMCKEYKEAIQIEGDNITCTQHSKSTCIPGKIACEHLVHNSTEIVAPLWNIIACNAKCKVSLCCRESCEGEVGTDSCEGSLPGILAESES